MALNAYIPQDTGNLKYVAEAEDAGPDDLPDFVEALQESLTGKAKDGPFVIMDIDAGFAAYVEFTEEEVVTVSRVLKVGGVVVGSSNGDEAAVSAPAPTKRRAKPGPKPGTARKAPAKAGTAKRTVKKAAPKKAPAAKASAAKTIRRGGGFKRNPASAE